HGYIDGASGIIASLVGAIFGFTVLGVLYCMGGMGGGDVKLLAAIGAWLLLPVTFWLLVASALAAGAYALIVIVPFGRFNQTWVTLRIIYYRVTAVARHLGADDNVEMAVGQNDRRTRVIPFAAMVAVGLFTLLAIAWYAGQFTMGATGP